MKKMLAVVLSAIMVTGSCAGIVMAEEPEAAGAPVVAEDLDLSEEVGTTEVSVTEKTVPCYMRMLDISFDLNLYFLNDVMDLPYVELKEWADVMVTAYEVMDGAIGYELYVEADGPIAQYTRENGYSMLFDFQKGTIDFDDYDGFVHKPGDSSLLDMVTMNSYTEDEAHPLLQRVEKGSFDRYGKSIEINLTDYDIPMCYVEGRNLHLVPLQTMRDLLFAIPLSAHAYYNGDAVYVAYEGDISSSELGEAYFSAPHGEMSPELAWYSYCELCLAMDYLYGLKESHDITTFDNVFTETGYKNDLKSTDPNIADGALSDFIFYYLDDLHSAFKIPSYRTSELQSLDGTGLSGIRDRQTAGIYAAARDAADHEIPVYEEVGNTAYVTFDHFTVTGQPLDYYEGNISLEEDPSSETLDTVALILYAHKRITREDSPVQNVVIDLSMNGGGDLDAAAVVAAWFLGEASISIRSSMTGAISTGTYRLDANLDGVFDEHDSVSDKNLYCLIGPYSFSCGNLVPNIFKSSRRVTLLGRESGGGSCAVLPMSTAYGSTFQISSPNHMSYLQNGSYLDTDTGFEPDSVIIKPENFYNRTALTERINQLY